MKNPLIKALLLASIPIGIVLSLWLLFVVVKSLGMDNGDAAFTFIVIAGMVAISVFIFVGSYDPTDMEVYRKVKQAQEEKRTNKLKDFEKEFQQMQKEHEELEKKVNERLSHWDDF